MIAESLSLLTMTGIKDIYVTVLAEHVEKAGFDVLGLIRTDVLEMCDEGTQVHFYQLSHPTNSQPETIANTIRHFGIKGQIHLKDCDNLFSAELKHGNMIGFARLSTVGKCVASNKSYIVTEEFTGNVVNIVEKKVASDQFCAGLYSFLSADEFLESFDREFAYHGGKDLWVSDLVYDMLLGKQQFGTTEVSDYSDWGTLEDWLAWRSRDAGWFSAFVDVDGVIVDKYSKPIQENIDHLNRLYSTGKCQIIIVTARRQTEEEVGAFLRSMNVPYDRILTNMLHATRIVVNDFAKTNPFPACEAINIARYSPTLREML